MIWRDLRRSASGCAGSAGIPRSVVMTLITSLEDVNRIDEVSHDQEDAEPDQQREHTHAHRDEPPEVDRAAITWPVTSAMPITLVTCPAGVLARFLENRSGTAPGRLAASCAEPTIAWPNCCTAYEAAPAGPDRW